MDKNKKTKKIDFKYFGKSFNPENNFLTNLLRKHYNIIITEDADYVFFSIYGEGAKNIGGIGNRIRKISPTLYRFSRKLYSKLFPQKTPELEESKKKVVKIFWGLETYKPDMSKCDWAFSYFYKEEINHPNYMRVPEYVWYGAGKNLVKDKNYVKRLTKQKTKFCNFIYSNEVKSRNDFFKKLNKYKKVDSPGKCMKNMPSLEENGRSGVSSEEWSKTKLNFIKNYKFTIAFENNIAPGYTDEKLYHAMLAGTIPIYYGNPLVHRDFNTKSFINCKDFKNFDEVVKKVIKLDKNNRLYEEMLSQPWYHNNKPSKYADIKRLEKRFKEIFG